MSANDKFANDRRREERVETDLAGVLSCDSKEFRCRLTNLSRIGTCAVSTAPVPDMTRVKIRLQAELDGAMKTVECEAAVVRCQKRPDGNYDLGLFFTHVPQSSRPVLEQVIASRAPITSDT